MKTLPAWLNDGVRIIGDHQFSEAENGNMLARAHQFTWVEAGGSLRHRRDDLSKKSGQKKKSYAPKGLIVTNWNSAQV